MEKREKKEENLKGKINVGGVVTLLMLFLMFVAELVGAIIGGEIGYTHSVFLMIVGGILGLIICGSIVFLIFLVIILIYERNIEKRTNLKI